MGERCELAACGTGCRVFERHGRAAGSADAGEPCGDGGQHVVDGRVGGQRDESRRPRGVGGGERDARHVGGFEPGRAVQPEGFVASELCVGAGERGGETGARVREPVTRAESATRDHLAHAGECARRCGYLDEQEVTVGCRDPHALLIDRHDVTRRRAGRRVEHAHVFEHVDVVAERDAHRSERVAIARAERLRAQETVGIGGRHRGVEKRGRSGELAEHAPLARRLGGRTQRARRELLGDAGEAVHTCLVATGVQRERGVVGEDRHRLGGDDLAAVDIVGHDVPGDGVFGLAGENRPRGHVQAAVPGQRAVVEVDVHRREREHCVGQHAQVRHAQQDVEIVLGERHGQVARRVDAGNAGVFGVLAHLGMLRGDDDHGQAVPAGDVGALGGERLVADERTTPGCAARRRDVICHRHPASVRTVDLGVHSPIRPMRAPEEKGRMTQPRRWCREVVAVRVISSRSRRSGSFARSAGGGGP